MRILPGLMIAAVLVPAALAAPAAASAVASAKPVTVVPLKEHIGKITVTGTYARGPAALKAPITARVKEYAAALRGHRAKVVVDTAVKLNGPRYASVRYDITVISKILSHPTWLRARTVTVDLRTGKALKGTDLFRPGADLRVLVKGRQCVSKLKFKRSDLNGPGLQFALTKDHLEVAVDGPYFGTATACGQQTFKIPYSKLPGLRVQPNR